MTPTARTRLDALTDLSARPARWDMVNQADELIVAHLNTSMGEAIYRLFEAQWPFAEQRESGIIPINHVLRYRTTGARVKVGQPLQRRTEVRLYVQEDRTAANLRRIHLGGTCELVTDDDATAARGEYWIALTRPFAPPQERRLTEIPERLKALVPHTYPDDAPVLQPAEQWLPSRAPEQVEQDWFHINQTDMNHHVNTIVYLDDAQTRCARAFARHCDAPLDRLRFRELDVFFRKPFAAGQRFEARTWLEQHHDRFESAVALYHCGAAGTPAERPSVALRLSGLVASA
ncbi:MAG: hypothetical protein D6761_04470 [Candidatus Dadabacteria bacterium]|nr:MAG: hypothetical protein D6761_04470 [Candidatus Dadabacteria bacterium]